MTPVIILGELLDRLGAIGGGKLLLTSHDLAFWPNAAAIAMKKQRLLTKVRPATSVICAGCEEQCCVPVHTVNEANGEPASFVVCDERDDTNRMPVSQDKLVQWQCSISAVCDFIAGSLGLRKGAWQVGSNGLWEIGVATGDKRCQMLCVQAADGLFLVAAKTRMPLSDLLVFDNSRYCLNTLMVRRMVDSSTAADERYTPSIVKRENRRLETQKLYASWQKAYRDLKKQHPNMSDKWCSIQIAKMTVGASRNAETIRKNMKL